MRLGEVLSKANLIPISDIEITHRPMFSGSFRDRVSEFYHPFNRLQAGAMIACHLIEIVLFHAVYMMFALS